METSSGKVKFRHRDQYTDAAIDIGMRVMKYVENWLMLLGCFKCFRYFDIIALNKETFPAVCFQV